MFDPYEKWLGIPKDQRPIDYFRLLDLNPDESDTEAIRKAVRKTAALVSTHQDGTQAQACARLLNEIDLARTTLLNPAKRKAYAATLTTTAPLDNDDPARRTGPRGKKTSAGKPSRKTPPPQEAGRAWLWVTLGSVAGLLFLLLCGVTAYWLSRPKTADVPVPAPVALAPPAPTGPNPNAEAKTGTATDARAASATSATSATAQASSPSHAE